MMHVVVFGTGDAASMKLQGLARRAVARCGSAGVAFDYVEVGPHDRYSGIDRLPALVIDGRVVTQGIVPKFRMVCDALAHAIEVTVEDVGPAAPAGDGGTSASGASGAIPASVPFCDGCGRGCSLAHPGCRVGRRHAHELGIPVRD